MSSPLRMIDWSAAAAQDLLGDTPMDFLQSLGGPSAIRIPGRDRERTRVLVTLLHGNEPSGVVALHRWLGELEHGTAPAVNALVVIASVDAALEPPGFANRMLPGRRDLNRCFVPPFDDLDGRVAGAILSVVGGAGPESVVDLHNNTGHNPAYGVVMGTERACLSLVALFADAAMITHLQLGALTEIMSTERPSVSIECGRSGDPAADACAYEGMRRYFGRDELAADDFSRMALFSDPIRVCVAHGLSVAFSDEPQASVHLTLVEHIESFNFDTVPAGEVLGWTQSSSFPLEAHGAGGADCAEELFEIIDGALVTRRAIVPVMMTTDARVAVADCLCYIVSPVGPDRRSSL